jgi:hypothetical protein
MGCQCIQNVKKEEKDNENNFVNDFQNGTNINENISSNIIKIRNINQKFDSFSNQATKSSYSKNNNIIDLKYSFNNNQNLLIFQILE